MGPLSTQSLITTGIIFGIWARIYLPLPGVSIAILAAVAAIMSLRPEMRIAEKAAWLLVVGLLLSAELQSIRADRIKNDAQYLRDRKEQNDKFQAVLGNITGGDSYSVVLPNVATGGDEIPLFIRNRGQKPLTGVTVLITRSGIMIRMTQDDILKAARKRDFFGALHPGESIILSQSLQPPANTPNGEIVRFYVMAGAQNFTTQEYLNLRKVGKNTSGTDSWEYSYKVYKKLPPQILKPGQKPIPDPLLEHADWTTAIDPTFNPTTERK